MKKVLIFSGTTEGRELAKFLSEQNIATEVCIATEYGQVVMPKLPNVLIHQGRMDAFQIEQYVMSGHFVAVVDATHPFATIVSQNIKQAVSKLHIPYIRLKRQTAIDKKEEKMGQIFYFDSMEQVLSDLQNREGNILLTTGSKDLNILSNSPELINRLYVRVLPSIESIEKCNEYGIKGKQIIAMQGPFSEEMNLSTIKQFHIQYLVTKESGNTGGVDTKLLAAAKAQIPVYVIGNSQKNEEGYTFDEVCAKVLELIGLQRQYEISLVGIGMGNCKTMTFEARKVIDEAEYIFGAQRMLEAMESQAVKYPYYLADDIIPIIENKIPKGSKIVILLSGDSGFYSGGAKLYQVLNERSDYKVKLYPGISSISYLAAKVGISWQDAVIASTHGRGSKEKWGSYIIDTVKHHEKTFLLLSNVFDVQSIGTLLEMAKLEHCQIILGYQLSYEEEEIMELNPSDCKLLNKEGLYSCFIFNLQKEKRFVLPVIKDADFTRSKVPMTKEEIRKISICKMQLTEESIVYDIGSGTGSIACEIAALDGKIKVYALEKKPQAMELIEENRQKFSLLNVEIIPGMVPQTLENLPAATHAFIGGTSGTMKEVIDILYQKNCQMRVVINAISLETIQEIAELKNDERISDLEIVQLQVSKMERIGNYQLMKAENPVMICSFQFQKQSKEY